jgi:hypothetical protein
LGSSYQFPKNAWWQNANIKSLEDWILFQNSPKNLDIHSKSDLPGEQAAFSAYPLSRRSSVGTGFVARNGEQLNEGLLLGRTANDHIDLSDFEAQPVRVASTHGGISPQ